jgi:hypothetical protein
MTDRHAAWLDRRVAEAAEAWLTDPRDPGVYARLVAALADRRAYLQPRLDEHQDPDVGEAGPDELPGMPAGVPLGELLAGADPRAVLAQLRGDAAADRRPNPPAP